MALPSINGGFIILDLLEQFHWQIKNSLTDADFQFVPGA
jgi:hypothetical protein